MFVELPLKREAGMGDNVKMAIADRFAAYVGELTKVVLHADRAGPLRDYCSGLLATDGRRSVEPQFPVNFPDNRETGV
jgi:SRSO17 transposase